jgi:hypothetical protein
MSVFLCIVDSAARLCATVAIAIRLLRRDIQTDTSTNNHLHIFKGRSKK